MASPFNNGYGNNEPQRSLDRLTSREIEVLKLMADGLTTKQISKALGIAFKTAACHRYRILDKLGVETTVEAVRWAIRGGIIEP
jgi:DNA-binding NarL/FixJ family response regulator